MTEIADGLSRLGTTALLFLQEIEEIRWSVDGTPIGFYLREAVAKGPDVRSVTVVGQKRGEPEAYDEWLVFSRPVHTEGGRLGGRVELAWLTEEDQDGRKLLRAVQRSPLVVFFPTVVETELGFLIQGPYRTTPSRDNVPPRDEWNRTCVRETGALLIESLRWLRAEGLLDATALSCLPLDSVRFKGSMFRELFEDLDEESVGAGGSPADSRWHLCERCGQLPGADRRTAGTVVAHPIGCPAWSHAAAALARQDHHAKQDAGTTAVLGPRARDPRIHAGSASAAT